LSVRGKLQYVQAPVEKARPIYLGEKGMLIKYERAEIGLIWLTWA